MDKKSALFVGGNLWDGRATGERLGNLAADQAQGPFLNPVEQGLPDPACVVYRVCNGDYAAAFQAVATASVCVITWPGDAETVWATELATVGDTAADRGKVGTAYDDIALFIADYEGSVVVNAFSSLKTLSDGHF